MIRTSIIPSWNLSDVLGFAEIFNIVRKSTLYRDHSVNDIKCHWGITKSWTAEIEQATSTLSPRRLYAGGATPAAKGHRILLCTFWMGTRQLSILVCRYVHSRLDGFLVLFCMHLLISFTLPRRENMDLLPRILCVFAFPHFWCYRFLLGNSKLSKTCNVSWNSLSTAMYNEHFTLIKIIASRSQTVFHTASSSRIHPLICAKKLSFQRLVASASEPTHSRLNTLSTR